MKTETARNISRTRWKAGFFLFTVAAITAGCGGSSDAPVSRTAASEGTGGAVSVETMERSVRVRGIAKGARIRVTGMSGSSYEAEANSRGHFVLMLPRNDTYVIGFEHDDVMGSHFAGYMTFACGPTETDRLTVTGRRRAISFGKITMRGDGGFARPARNPLKQMDSDGDGIPDFRDADTDCATVADDDHDGFYDDDMDHDGHHDDDTDSDGYHDCEMDHMGHDNRAGDCPPMMTRTPVQTPAMGRTTNPHAPMRR
jgi:hypothetical protein